MVVGIVSASSSSIMENIKQRCLKHYLLADEQVIVGLNTDLFVITQILDRRLS